MRLNSIRTETVGLIFGAIIGVGVLAGCSQNSDNAPTPAAPPVVVAAPAPAAPATTVVDTTTTTGTTTAQTNNPNAGPGGATGAASDIGDAVVKAIHTNVQMTGSRVIATADASGVVRLTGTAQNKQQKALAENTARQTAGVTSVVNKIEIVPTGGVKASAAKPTVIEKTKVVVVHDQAPAAAASDDGSTDSATGTTTGSDSNP